MNHCRTSSRALRRARRNRSTALTRLTGVAILLMAVTVRPMAVFAAEPAVETQDKAVVVFVVIVLLFGSMTAGLFFASPLRRRLASEPEAAPGDEMSVTGVFGADHEVQQPAHHLFDERPQSGPPVVQRAWPAPGASAQQPPQTVSQPLTHAQPAAMPIPPSASAQLVIPTPSPAQRGPVASPWSTGRPQPDANWDPGRRRAP